MKIGALLNHSSPLSPTPSAFHTPATYNTSPTPTTSSFSSSAPLTPASVPTSAPTPISRTKMNKRLIMERAPANGHVEYAPYELTEQHGAASKRQKLLEMQRKFKIGPAGGAEGLIGDYVKSVPYTSSRPHLGSKSGRLHLELMQYTFVLPGTDSEFAVLWDYKNGMVQITPFFKALNHVKTAPSRALNSNEGLQDLAIHVNGGCIHAQGYWIPYACAKELCASFCYKIRWALTPLFGPDFADECTPEDSPRFKAHLFSVSSETIRYCTLRADDSAATAIRSESPITNVDPFVASRSATPQATSIGRKLPVRSTRRQRPLYAARDTSQDGSEIDDCMSTPSDVEHSPPVSPKTITGIRKPSAISDRRPSHLRLATATQPSVQRSQYPLTPFTVNSSPAHYETAFEQLGSLQTEQIDTPRSSTRKRNAQQCGWRPAPEQSCTIDRNPDSEDEVVTSSSSEGDTSRMLVSKTLVSATEQHAPPLKKRKIGIRSKGPAARRVQTPKGGPTSCPSSTQPYGAHVNDNGIQAPGYIRDFYPGVNAADLTAALALFDMSRS